MLLELMISRKSFFCNMCKVVQPPTCNQANFFEYFSCPQSFVIDLEDLQAKYYALQRKLHPDKFHTKSEKEKLFSRDQSASLNSAYKVLSNNLLRAQYLLQLQGEDVLGEGKKLVDIKLLNEILMTREELSEATSPQEIKAIGIENIRKCKKTVEKLSENFRMEDVDSAKKNTIYLQYLSKIQEEVEQMLGEKVVDQQM